MNTPEDAPKTAVDHLRDRIELLETRLRHMENDFEVTRAENDTTNERYLEMLANLENLVAERTAQLEQKSAELQMMIDSTPSLFMYLDSNGRFMRVNKAFETMLNLDGEAIIGKSVRQLQPDQNPEFATRNRRVVDTGKPLLQSEEVFLAGDKRLRLLIDRKPYFNADGDLLGVVCFALDVTAAREEEMRRIDLEKRMRQTQKMEAIGVLAGGVAHDFNNILSIVIGYADLIANEDEALASAKTHAREVLSASMRARDLVRQILTFSRQAEQERKPLMMSHIVKEVMRMIRASLPSSIEVASQVDSKVVVLADPVQMHQVLMHLCANAWNAMKDGCGVLDVKLKDVARSDAPETICKVIDADNLLMLQVRDTGHGIDPVIRDRIFDPYFTTKKKSEGAGMGLSIVHGIVTASGGVIDVDSAPGQGSTFTVWLPALSEEKVIVNAPAPHQNGDARLLLVDDERQIIEMQAEALQKRGYSVVTRNCSLEAFKLFENNPHRFDLIVTDLTMPNMSGLELAEKIRAIRADIPIILCTGFSDRINDACLQDGLVDCLLLKPLYTTQLVEEIERALAKS